MPRPRSVSDEDLFAAAYRLMQSAPPSQFTLQAVAAEAGVTAAAVVQRFGSKRAFQVALAKAASASSNDLLQLLDEKSDDPIGALRYYADCVSGLAPSPAAIVRNLAYLQEDLADSALRAELKRQSLATRKALEDVIRKGIRSKAISSRADARSLARAIETMLSGALLTWAIYQEGTAKTWLRGRLDDLLAPWIS
jgi:AcrR family transcriptional regulator